jgi:hypothetical protein
VVSGAVYLAQHPRLPRQEAAVKVLDSALGADAEFRPGSGAAPLGPGTPVTEAHPHRPGALGPA